MIGRLAGTKDAEEGKNGKTEKYKCAYPGCAVDLLLANLFTAFKRTKCSSLALFPPELYHRYVEFRPFVKGMFTSTSIRGRLLHHALMHQHDRVYT